MREKIKNVIIMLIVVLLVAYAYLDKENNLNQLEIHFLDVGQGDSILVKLPNEEILLIDAGTRSSGPYVVDYLKNHDIDKIDYLIATHPHEDHIGGLPEVISKFSVKTAYLPNKTNNTKIFEQLLLSIKKNNIELIEAKAGVNILDSKDLKLDILGPVKSYNDINNNSVLLKLEYEDFVSLFTGDMEKKAELDVLNKNINSDLLKVSHHGSDTSSSEMFLNAVNPKYAVISVGEKNKYGHPNAIILDRLNKNGSKIFRTDMDGDIIFIYNDGEVDIEKNKE